VIGGDWGAVPSAFALRAIFVRDPRRRYRRSLNGVRARRHAYTDNLYQKKRKAKQ
jgi:hypothetical protein